MQYIIFSYIIIWLQFSYSINYYFYFIHYYYYYSNIIIINMNIIFV